MTPYDSFLATKAQYREPSGFKPVNIPSFLFDFQAYAADWNIHQGRSADFLDCGMGKTAIELVYADNVVRHSNRPILIQTPLAVAQQIVKEGEKFGIEVQRTAGGSPKRAGIYVTNYEKLHLFSPDDWIGCVCDESSCLKAFDGFRRTQVTEFMRLMPYRLCSTATAAPNDYTELGTTSEALGVMGQVDMLNRFFKNDANNSDMKRIQRRAPAMGGPQSKGWRFKGHAEIPFWRFICSFARAGRKPSDLGAFDDARFVLPPLTENTHIIETATLPPGKLYATAATNRREEMEERRRTIQERCEAAARLVEHTRQPFIIWCQLNPEGDLLEKLLGDSCVQISGSDSDDEKEEKYRAFLSGEARGMVSKQKIGGWGLNCQHCAHVVEFADHSFEAHYQGVRRCWRFGQSRAVVNDIIATEGQQSALESMKRKAEQCSRMFDSLLLHMHRKPLRIEGGYEFTEAMEVPAWL